MQTKLHLMRTGDLGRGASAGSLLSASSYEGTRIRPGFSRWALKPFWKSVELFTGPERIIDSLGYQRSAVILRMIARRNRRGRRIPVEPNFDRRKWAAFLERDIEREEQAILKVRVGQEQYHGHQLFLTVCREDLRDLVIAHRARVQSHPPGKLQRSTIGARPTLGATLKLGEVVVAKTRATEVGGGRRAAVFTTIRVGGYPPHLAAQNRPEGTLRPMQPVKIEHCRRGARKRSRRGSGPVRQDAPRSGYRLGKGCPRLLARETAERRITGRRHCWDKDDDEYTQGR